MIEIGSPTSKPGRYKGPSVFFLRRVPCVRFQFRHFPRGPVRQRSSTAECQRKPACLRSQAVTYVRKECWDMT
jgi:hypothetical protein